MPIGTGIPVLPGSHLIQNGIGSILERNVEILEGTWGTLLEMGLMGKLGVVMAVVVVFLCFLEASMKWPRKK